MKKSILLSSFIMLLILFVTLTTTTFAWYQASGGNITISGSSTASVTTTGPDSPYLVIGTTNNGAWQNSSSEGYNYSSYQSINMSDFTLHFCSVLTENSFDYGNNEATTKYQPLMSSDTITPLALTFYIKNTSSSFDLTANISVKHKVNDNWVELPSNYCYAIVFSECVYVDTVSINVIQSSQKAILHSGYHTYSANPTASNIISGNNNLSVRVGGGQVITVKFYLWMDSFKDVDTVPTLITNSSEAPASNISDLKISFSSIEICTNVKANNWVDPYQ